MSSNFITFPKDFIWGSATSSFQIEGHPLADGATKSSWWEFTRNGRIKNGDTADIAIDFYHRYKSDIALMKEMGLKAFRFSVSWPRIVPERGKVNEKGLDFYRRVVDELIANGITPSGTLYHWEVPTWAVGEWENRETAIAFREYAEVVLKKLGKDVPYWSTFNEPNITAELGWLQDLFPPGKADRKLYGRAVHHINLAHALTVQTYREMKLPGQIGIVLTLCPWKTIVDKPGNQEQIRKMDDLHARTFLNHGIGKTYPDYFLEFSQLPKDVYEKDLKTLQQPIDFVGVNHYNPNYASAIPPGTDIFDNDWSMPEGIRINDMGWAVDPPAFYDLLVSLWKEYGFKQMYVTENGIPTRDSKRSPKEIIEDDIRVHFYGTYMEQAHKAIQAGVPLKGYYAWSLFDNFEWCEGYDPRFGLIHVDFKTQVRTWKNSAKWYKKVIADGGFDTALLPKDPPYFIHKHEATKKGF
jgi:beta-glucosidase